MRGLFLINIIKVVCIIIGTFIGAGFASGKEIYLFFFRYGIYGIAGIIISSIIVGFIINKAIYISKNNEIENYDEFLDCILERKYIKKLLNNIIDLFLIISFCVMISGFCAFVHQEFNINMIISCTAILIWCYCILKNNINGIVKINNILIPMIICIIIYITVKKVDNSFIYLLKNKNIIEFNFKFILHSILYANYNLLTIIPIIITAKKFIKNKKCIKIISIICTIIIFVLSMSIFVILAQGDANIKNFEMPIVFIVGNYGKIYKYIYCLIIGVAIFTTAISVGYGYLQKYEKNKKIYNKKIILLILGAIISMPIGFSKLIEILYPIFGFIGLIQSVYIIKSAKK